MIDATNDKTAKVETYESAESDPNQKETLIKLIMNMLSLESL